MANYAIKDFNKEHMARAMGRGLPISFKQSVEVCNFIRGKRTDNVKKILKDVLEKKTAIPFRRFNKGVGHKKIHGPGRYPIKVTGEIIRLLETVEANAQFKGLNTSNLIIKHICAHKAGKAWHYGRKRRRQMKRTNVEVVVEEKATKKQEPQKESKSTITKDSKKIKEKKENQNNKKKGSKDKK